MGAVQHGSPARSEMLAGLNRTARGWVEQANCRGMNPDLFFPERGELMVEAKVVCAACAVRAECLDYALRHGIKHGAWGGLSEKQRRSVKRTKRDVA